MVISKNLKTYLVQERLRHLELGAEFGDGRQDGERGRVGIIQGGREHAGAEVEAGQLFSSLAVYIKIENEDNLAHNHKHRLFLNLPEVSRVLAVASVFFRLVCAAAA